MSFSVIVTLIGLLIFGYVKGGFRNFTAKECFSNDDYRRTCWGGCVWSCEISHLALRIFLSGKTLNACIPYRMLRVNLLEKIDSC